MAESRSDVTGERIVAAVADLVVLLIAFVALSFATGEAGWVDRPDGSRVFDVSLSGASFGLWAAACLAYYTFSEALFGRTLGKLAMSVRVTMADGSPVTPRAVVIRNIFRVVDGLPVFYLVGMLVVGLNKQRRRLGDMVAKTQVVGRQSI